MSMVTESMKSAEYFERLEKMEAMPALRLENGTWRLTVLPKQNGKLIEMFHKPTERHFLSAITHDNVLQGALDEVAQKGFTTSAFTPFDATQDGNTIHLSRTLDDGSTVERTIALNDADIVFTTRIIHRGAEPNRYYFRARPEFNAFSDSN